MADEQAPPASDEWCNALALITPYEFSWQVMTWDWYKKLVDDEALRQSGTEYKIAENVMTISEPQTISLKVPMMTLR